MKITEKAGFEIYLKEALKVNAKTDFGAFGRLIADKNRMSDELLEELERNEPVETLKSDFFISSGDFLEMSVSMQKD